MVVPDSRLRDAIREKAGTVVMILGMFRRQNQHADDPND
jgi:hypothetical protein